MSPSQRVCLVPKLAGVGGMVTFENKLAAGLAAQGIQVTYDLSDAPYEAILVIGGTRDLAGLWQARRRGVRIVQRLDGMNWLQRVRRTGLRHFLRAEYGNFILSIIRSRLASSIVYQSHFSRSWWERMHGPTRCPSQVVYNGVNLKVYSPSGISQPEASGLRLLRVEGSLGGGYEMGLETAVQLAGQLSALAGCQVELVVAGQVTEELKETWLKRAEGFKLVFAGRLPLQKIPELDRSAHLLFSADLNAACPNSVIEALACGLPVVAYDTGALPELVTGQAGRIVAYGGDPWRLDPPDIPALAQAALEIRNHQDIYRLGARRRAEEAFSLDSMVKDYLQALRG